MPDHILLAVCDSPTLNSGFAKLAQNLLRRWKKYFKRIDVWAIGHSGFPGVPGRVSENEWMQPPFVLYPATYGDEPWYSSKRLQALINHTCSGDYTHVWIVQDHFHLAQHKFSEVFKTACESAVSLSGDPVPKKRNYYYVPIDAQMEKSWAESAENFHNLIAYTEFGKKELERHVSPRCPEIRVITHGVDTNVYRPLPDRLKLREDRSGGWIKPDDIVLAAICANQRRKDVIRSLEIIAKLREHDSRFKLLMHMREIQPENDGISLKVAAAQLGLTHGLEWQCTDDGKNFRGLLGTLSEEDLNALYNCGDVFLTTTLGEGFGFGQVEAAAAGLIVAAPVHTACLEIMKKFAELGDPYRFIPLPIESGTVCLNLDNSRLRHRVDLEAAVQRILKVCKSYDFSNRPPLNDQIREWLSWDRIAAEWTKLFDLRK